MKQCACPRRVHTFIRTQICQQGKKIPQPHTHAHYYNTKPSDERSLWVGLQTA